MNLTTFLEQFATEERIQKFKEVLSFRTRYITVVLEDIYQSQNANAVLRTCDCFGVQDVHIIENIHEYGENPDVSLGSSKWLNLFQYNQKANNTLDAIQSLKKKGYRIVATSPHTNDISLPDFDLTKGKVALFFGTELTGISDIVKENADEFVTIPMYGFTESYNISVSAALCMQTLIPKLHTSGLPWPLSDVPKEKVYLQWLRQTIREVEKLERRFYQEYPG